MSEVPETDSEISQWLIKLYEAKNEMLSQWKSEWDTEHKRN